MFAQIFLNKVYQNVQDMYIREFNNILLKVRLITRMNNYIFDTSFKIHASDNKM